MIHVAPSHLRIDSLLTGVFISYLEAFHAAGICRFMKRFGAWLPFVSIGLLSPVAFMMQVDPFIYTIGFSMIAWALPLVVVVAVGSALWPAIKAARLKVVDAIGYE